MQREDYLLALVGLFWRCFDVERAWRPRLKNDTGDTSRDYQRVTLGMALQCLAISLFSTSWIVNYDVDIDRSTNYDLQRKFVLLDCGVYPAIN